MFAREKIMFVIYSLVSQDGNVTKVKVKFHRDNLIIANEMLLDPYFSTLTWLCKNAKNGDSLYQGNYELGRKSSYLGFFYSKHHEQLEFYKHNHYRGQAKKWIFAACDAIGDQSSLSQLFSEAHAQGWKFERQKSNGLTYELFEMPAELVLTTTALASYRIQWRRKNGIQRDCRTYSGQPKRNMVLA